MSGENVSVIYVPRTLVVLFGVKFNKDGFSGDLTTTKYQSSDESYVL